MLFNLAVAVKLTLSKVSFHPICALRLGFIVLLILIHEIKLDPADTRSFIILFEHFVNSMNLILTPTFACKQAK